MKLQHSSAVLAGMALLVACASAPHPAVPAPIAVAPELALAISVGARGVQIYECRPGPDGGAHQWTFVAPEAELLDAAGRPVGTHGAGPHWAFDDGTRVTGRVKARADAASPGAIPWLLLQARTESRAGRFGDLRSIQRIHTQGGTAPASGCSAPETGRQLRVPYTADYLFFAGR